MNDEVCLEKHKRVDERLDVNERRLNNHADRLDKLEQNQSSINTKIETLCDQIKTLVGLMKWFIGIWVTSLLGFFFYAIQSHIFK